MNPKYATNRPAAAHARVTAVLGPTNTGKTHFAIERMLAHRSGMIGLPLRLLAREVYDKVVRLKGAEAAALVTGEEKIVPPGARYFVCTVEAMPLDLGVSFLAIDEIQLCADPERGHVFTDRLLNARGEDETMFLGAETMRGTIQRFVPDAHFITRPRFSDLAYTGAKKLTRLPRRSAIVAFSAEDVYGIAELVRRQRGGAAVVLGALSPRTRNAQVALYQNGDVDFLVATDAIGMGLNMDVDHVAFSPLTKFDGVGMRPLSPDEIGQIAGRAGRHMNDGTFGVTADAEPLRTKKSCSGSKAIATSRCGCCNGAIRSSPFIRWMRCSPASKNRRRCAGWRRRGHRSIWRPCAFSPAMTTSATWRARRPPCACCGMPASFPISAS